MPELAPVDGADLHDDAWHWAKLQEFTELKGLIGEPSPHMTVINHLTRGRSLEERLWAIGCYAVPYSLVTAVALLEAFGWDYVQDHEGQAWFRPWITHNWEGIHTRTERRAVRTAEKFTISLASYADWVRSGEAANLLDSSADYEAWWASVNRVEFFGRYISIRVIEAIRRSEHEAGRPHPEMELPDIRGIGGHSPVRALTLFFPANAADLLRPDWKRAEELAEYLYLQLRMRGAEGISRYVLAAMLCEYREAFEDLHQYPGRTLDQELEYLHHPKAAYWAKRGLALHDILEARRELFPDAALGEVGNRWQGVRHELSRWLRERNENWSDLRYTWAASAGAPMEVAR